MSNSYKKHPVVTIGKNSYLKRLARKKLRKNGEISNFSNYKRHFDSWDICDCKFYIKREENSDSIWQNAKWFRK